MVIDSVIRHWATLVEGPQEGSRQEGLGTSIQNLSALFYVDDVIVALPESACIQGVLNFLMGLFKRLGLRNNKEKKVSMACRPCHTPQVW